MVRAVVAPFAAAALVSLLSRDAGLSRWSASPIDSGEPWRKRNLSAQAYSRRAGSPEIPSSSPTSRASAATPPLSKLHSLLTLKPERARLIGTSQVHLRFASGLETDFGRLTWPI